MISPFHSLINYEQEDFEDYLKKVHLITIFKDVIEEFPDDYKGVIRFILWAYSIDSDMLHTTGNSWIKVSKEIFAKTELHNEYFDDVANLKSDSVLKCVEKWLNYQGDENYTQWVHYRDLRRQMLLYSVSDLKKSSGEIDINAKMDAAIHSKTLLSMMQDAIETFVQNHTKLRASVEAFNKSVSKEKAGKNIADYVNEEYN